MREILQAWLERKLRGYRGIERPARVTEVWQRATNGQMFAGLTLSATPAGEFSFESRANWPAGAEAWEQRVVDGILDVLCPRNILGATLVLEAIQWDDRRSVAIAFYFAARSATEKILDRNVSALPVKGTM